VNSIKVEFSFKTDVLIIGSGLAGTRAAISVLENSANLNVSVLSFPVRFRGSSSFSAFTNGWGLQYPISDEDKSTMKKDIINAGKGYCDEKLVDVLVENAALRVRELFKWGVKFRKTEEGNLYRFKGCFSTNPRDILAYDMDNLKNVFKKILSDSRVEYFEGWLVINITQKENLWVTTVINSKGMTAHFVSKAVILSPGGGAGIYRYNLNYPYNMGHGYRLGAILGLKPENMEFVQYIFGVIYNEYVRFLLNQKVISAAREIYDPHGFAFMKRTFGNKYRELLSERMTHAPFSCSFNDYEVDLVLFKKSRDNDFRPLEIRLDELDEDNIEKDIFLRTWVKWFKKRCKSNSLNFSHCAHAFNGGFLIKPDAGTDKPGLFIAGELATGMHGADRVGGTMLLSCMVFGEIAGTSTVKYINSNSFAESNTIDRFIPGTNESGTFFGKDEIKHLTKELMYSNWKYISIIRTGEGLRSYLKYLNSLESYIEGTSVREEELYDFYNLLSTCVTSKMIAEAALKNSRTVGSHYIEDGK